MPRSPIASSKGLGVSGHRRRSKTSAVDRWQRRRRHLGRLRNGRVAYDASAVACYDRVMDPSSFDTLSELFARDVDRELLRRAQARTPTERILWLEEMQEFAAAAKKAQADEVERAARAS